MKYYHILLILLVFSSIGLNAQIHGETEKVSIETTDNKIFVGELMYITSDSIFINNDNGQLAFDKTEVRHIHNGEFISKFTKTTNSSVPYYVQTAIPNGKGNHYYKNYYVFGNEFNFGLSDNFNFTTGFETATLVFDSGGQFPVIQLGAKYSIKGSDAFHLGLSTKFYFSNDGNVHMITIPFTFGGERTNFTLSPSYISADNEKNIGVFLNLSLGLRSKTRFVIDYARIDGASIFAPNFEFLFGSGFSLSIGGLITSGGAAPSLSFSIPFGKWKKKYNK